MSGVDTKRASVCWDIFDIKYLKVVGGEKLTVPAVSGQTLYVFVDGYKYGKGYFHLTLSLE